MTDTRSRPESSHALHTPGPWVQHQMLIRNARGEYICDIKFPDDDPEIQVNARLIAAAPDMDEAIEQALDDMADSHCVCEETKQMLIAALAKARGASQ